MERKKIVFLAEVAILAALILLMSFTPLGYLRLPGLSVSLLMIPVAIGAVVVGPAAGAMPLRKSGAPAGHAHESVFFIVYHIFSKRKG